MSKMLTLAHSQQPGFIMCSGNKSKWNQTLVLLVFLNLVASVQLKVMARTSGNKESRPSGFSWDIATDNPALYDIISMLDLDSLVEELTEVESNMKNDSHSHTRRKRSSYASNYGKRVHERVKPMDTQNPPFSAAVRVGNKCTGSLISDRHVLTAAHCVHNRKRWKYKLPDLKVGFLQRNGKFHWIRVTKMFVPDAWKNSAGKKDYSVMGADYAVLRLKRPHGRSHFLPQRSSYHQKSPMMFNGFPGDKGGKTMWHSSCRVRKISGDLLLSKCNASEGSSGSGVYVSRGRGGYGATGIVSAAVKIRKGRHRMSLTITSKLTPSKVKLICHWIGREPQCKW